MIEFFFKIKFRPYTQFSVRVGLTKLSEAGTEYEWENIITHPNYSTSSFQNDIALIKLKKTITFNSKCF